MPTSTIRPYDPARDRAAVLACGVVLQEYERAIEPSLPRAEEMAEPYLDHVLARVAEHAGRVFVAEVGQAVVGFIAVLGRVLPEAPDDEPIAHAYVSDLVVLPEHRGQGLGRQLLAAAEAHARTLGTQRLDIGVLWKNPAAARLYRNFGFTDFRIQLRKRLDERLTSGPLVSPAMAPNRTPLLLTGSIVLFGLLVLSGLEPFDRITWIAEVAPVVIAWPILFATRRSFPLTTLVYGLIFLHGVILIVGGAYSYARVPLGFAVAEWLDLSRNPYDKLGHFAQGFVPALIARELLIRGAYVNGDRMRAFLVVCFVLAVSAGYELIEWAAALLLGQGAEEFLGTQGDPWDTQSDMFTALLGAVAALALLSRFHDRQIRQRSA